MAKSRSPSELIKIAAAGGGFTIDAGSVNSTHLVQIAAAASGKGSRVHLRNAGHLSTRDLVMISAAGKGAVSFDLFSEE